MKKLLLILMLMVLSACCDDKPETSKHTSEKYYPIKICTIGDVSGESCVMYAATFFEWDTGYLKITTVDGHKYRFNNAGWSILITKK